MYIFRMRQDTQHPETIDDRQGGSRCSDLVASSLSKETISERQREKDDRVIQVFEFRF